MSSQFQGARVRMLTNGDIVLPCNMAYVIKKIEGFEFPTCSASLAVTTVLAIKVPHHTSFLHEIGLNINEKEVEEVRAFLETKLKARYNEVEEAIKDKLGKSKRVKSASCQDNDKDIVSFTLRTAERLVGDHNDFSKFPFDALDLKFRFELSHFELGGRTYRFDLHYADNQVNFKEDVAGLQDYEINFRRSKLEIHEEHKVDKSSGNKCLYYPVQTVTVQLLRDPRQ